jgi:hypothetical protein
MPAVPAVAQGIVGTSRKEGDQSTSHGSDRTVVGLAGSKTLLSFKLSPYNNSNLTPSYFAFRP